MSTLFERWFPAPEPQPQPLPVADMLHEFTVDLASRIEGSHLRAVCAVRWYGDFATEEADRDRLSRLITGHAQAEVREFTAARLEAAEIAVNARLSRVAPPAGSRIRSMAVTVRLTADQQTREAAVEWEKLRTQLAVNRLKAQLEVERLRHLRDDIFARPDVARAYWLDKHPNDLDEVLGDRFERVAERITSGPQPSTLAVANVIREFLAGLGTEHKQVMMSLLHKTLADFGRADLALRLPPDPGDADGWSAGPG